MIVFNAASNLSIISAMLHQKFLGAVECVASGDYSCDQLDSDYCGMPENDLYACVIDDVGGC